MIQMEEASVEVDSRMNEIKHVVSLRRFRGRGKGRMNPGDVANHLVRCMLADASEIIGSWTGADRERTLAYFDYRCAFTGGLYDQATFVWDHLVPHNKESCGLHTYGNLVPATREANNVKADRDFREFLRHDRIAIRDTSATDRDARIRKLEAFQSESGYHKLSENLGGLSTICMEQYERMKAICQENKEAVRAHLAPLSAQLNPEAGKNARRSIAAGDALPIDYEVTPPSEFLAKFLEAGVAFIEEHYADGHTQIRQWKARKLTPRSNLVANIRSKPEYRYGKWQAAGLCRLVLRLTHPTLTR